LYHRSSIHHGYGIGVTTYYTDAPEVKLIDCEWQPFQDLGKVKKKHDLIDLVKLSDSRKLLTCQEVSDQTEDPVAAPEDKAGVDNGILVDGTRVHVDDWLGLIGRNNDCLLLLL